MEIGQKFNKLTLKEYIFYIDNHKKYTDFNTLGLYRSIAENEKLNIKEKLEVREYAHNFFSKFFNFLQLKDPYTFIQVSTLGLELSLSDERRAWEDVRINQQKILADKKIKHRNFGAYSKHDCPYDDCIWKGVMLRQDSPLASINMHFTTDKNRYGAKDRSEKNRFERKTEKQIIQQQLDNN